ncbi:MAG: crotonase/enoyl-CoA hydratase family protein [Acidimicrobiales bacterium]
MSDRVAMTVADGVADVRLDRPEKLNALDGAMFSALVDAAEQLSREPRVRVVVLSGNGRGFCAGLDVASFSAMADGNSGETSSAGAGSLTDRLPGRITNRAQQAAWAWTELEVPVIAALHGPVLGGGIQIALAADIRIVAPDAKLAVLEIRWGLLPDMTGAQMLPRLVGLDAAKELTFTGRVVSGREAVALGLATRLSDTPLEDALALAGEIASQNPDAIRGAKALLNAAGQRPMAESFLDESRRMAELIGSPNQIEAVMAHLGQRPAVFTDAVDEPGR